MAVSSDDASYIPNNSHLDPEKSDSTRHDQKAESTEDVVCQATSKEDEKSHKSDAPDSEGHRSEDDEGEENEPYESPIRAASSRASSIFSRSQTVVPRGQRRGLFGTFTIIPEIERPHEYTNRTKWFITAIIALAASVAPMGAGIFYRTFSSL